MRQADSHESLQFPIRANHPIRANRANRFARIMPLSSGETSPKLQISAPCRGRACPDFLLSDMLVPALKKAGLITSRVCGAEAAGSNGRALATIKSGALVKVASQKALEGKA